MSSLSRAAQLGLLNQVARQLFDEGVREEEAYERLTNDDRFDKVRRSTVQSIYSNLEKKRNSAEKTTIAKYTQKAYKYRYSEILLDDRSDWNKDYIYGLNSRFMFVVHDSIHDANFHCLTLMDLFNNKTRLD
jgi:hypothetical protein